MDSCVEFVKRYCTKATPIPTNRHRTCSFSQSRCASRSRARERVSRTVLLNCFSRRKRWRCCLALLVINFLPERKRDLIEAVGALVSFFVIMNKRGINPYDARVMQRGIAAPTKYWTADAQPYKGITGQEQVDILAGKE